MHSCAVCKSNIAVKTIPQSFFKKNDSSLYTSLVPTNLSCGVLCATMSEGVKRMKIKEISKYCLSLILNIAPFFLSCFLYEGGIAISLTFPALQFLINTVNYKQTNKIISYLFLNLAMLLSSVVSIKINTWLYYNNISSDTETLAVGSFEVQVCILFILLMTLISITCRILSKKSNQ